MSEERGAGEAAYCTIEDVIRAMSEQYGHPGVDWKERAKKAEATAAEWKERAEKAEATYQLVVERTAVLSNLVKELKQSVEVLHNYASGASTTAGWAEACDAGSRALARCRNEGFDGED